MANTVKHKTTNVPFGMADIFSHFDSPNECEPTGDDVPNMFEVVQMVKTVLEARNPDHIAAVNKIRSK
jgi:hypothetical protein